jgi:hypothetical protein
LLAGTATLQTIAVGQPLPQLVWDAGWLVILALGARAPVTQPSAAVATPASS